MRCGAAVAVGGGLSGPAGARMTSLGTAAGGDGGRSGLSLLARFELIYGWRRPLRNGWRPPKSSRRGERF